MNIPPDNRNIIRYAFIWDQHFMSPGNRKGQNDFLIYKGKNNTFIVAASISGLAIGGASTIGIAENAFTVVCPPAGTTQPGLSEPSYPPYWR